MTETDIPRRSWFVSFRGLNLENASSGIISATLAMTGPPVLILRAGAVGHYSASEITSWMFAVYVFGGIYSILMPLRYRMPITGAHSLTGVAFLVTVAGRFTYSQMIGGYLIAALLIVLAGMTGTFARTMQAIPNEVIAGMLSGMMMTYILHLVDAAITLPFAGVLATAGYLVLAKWGRRIPPVIGAIVLAFVGLFLRGGVQMLEFPMKFYVPSIHVPAFTFEGAIAIGIPLALLVLSNDLATGIGALQSYDFRPPTQSILISSGIASAVSALFGGQSANMAGMMSAICADESTGQRDKRYFASVISGILILLFGVCAWIVVPFIQTLPQTFTSMLAGFALLGPVGSSISKAFSNVYHHLSAIVAFAVAMSGVSFFHVSAPVWSLVLGFVVARLAESPRKSQTEARR